MTEQSNILIVEDRTDWQDIVSSTVSAQGFVAQAVASYDSALMALDKQRFDLAVIDPVLDTDRRINRDGLTIIQKISELQPGTPMIIITGSLTADIQTSLQKLCPTAPIFLKESWNPAEFMDSIHQLVGKKWPNLAPKNEPTPDVLSTPTQPIHPLPLNNTNYPRILLVENNKSWQTIVGDILNQAKCFWRAAYTAQEALQELEKESFHLAILDLKLQPNNLPLRSNEGWLLLDHLTEHYPKTKVIVLSGKATAGDVAHLLTQYAAIRFFEKQNFKPEALFEAIAMVTKVPDLTIRTLGQFRITRNNKVFGVWEPPEIETLLKLLLARRARSDEAIAADELISRLWPDADEEEGRRKLLPAINRARYMLEPDIEARDSNFILRSANGYYFNLNEQVNWDLMTFREYLSHGKAFFEQKQWQEAMIELEKGQALYRGDFMDEDRHLDWANDMRRQLVHDYCELLTHLADTYAAKGQYNQAIEVCETILRKDPLLEGIYRRLMRFYYCQGQKGQALKAYRNCIKLFEELFGEGPTTTTIELNNAIQKNATIECLETEA